MNVIGDLLSDRLSLLPVGVALAILAWDVVMSGWIASQRKGTRVFTSLTAFCGLLVAPAAFVAVASGIESAARTLVGITWIWPLIVLCFTAQVLYAIGARLVSAVVGVPLLLYDLGVSMVAVGDFLVSMNGHAPEWLQGAVAARDAIAGVAIGRASLISPLVLLVPMIAPAHPARWKASAGVRAVLTLIATIMTTVLCMEWPQGVGAVKSYQSAAGVRMQERPRGDFAIGLRMFPSLSRAPTLRIVRADMKLADTIGAKVVLVVVQEEGARAAVLDSLSRLLQPFRTDSGSVIAVAIALERTPSRASNARRMAAVERILRRVSPHVIVPAWRAPLPSVLPYEPPGVEWWKATLESTARVVERVRPATRVGWAATRVDITDSLVYDWASRKDSPVSVLGVVSFPSFAGLPSVDARLRAFERWHTLALPHADSTNRHWLFEVGGLPHAHGDASQTAAIMQALAWGTRRQWISAAILGDAGDYDGTLGLRAANGRIRPVVGVLARAARGLRESSTGAR